MVQSGLLCLFGVGKFDVSLTSNSQQKAGYFLKRAVATTLWEESINRYHRWGCSEIAASSGVALCVACPWGL